MHTAWRTENASDSDNHHLSSGNRLLLQDLGRRLGVTLDMPEGAVRLSVEDSPAWFLEITDDGEFWIIHTEICPRIDATPETLSAYLRLNAQVALMRGAAVCIEENTDTVRLYSTIATRHLDIEMLETAFAHLMQLHHEHISLIPHF